MRQPRFRALRCAAACFGIVPASPRSAGPTTGVELRGPERSEGRRLGQTLPWFQDGGGGAGALAQAELGV